LLIGLIDFLAEEMSKSLGGDRILAPSYPRGDKRAFFWNPGAKQFAESDKGKGAMT
jgi:hypothetical protein